MNVGHVYVDEVRKAMDVSTWRAKTMNVELYSRHLQAFLVTKTTDRQPSIPPRRCNCGKFQALWYSCGHGIAACAET
ncbi:hypothetical protein GOBAR_DD09658 [Gossypium barbadense]|nr:hypothetical protein GOBAR_DD09658 [Gossypium barbadense]